MIPAPTSPDKPHLIRLPNWLGDVVMALPLLRAIRSGRPDAEIILILGSNAPKTSPDDYSKLLTGITLPAVCCNQAKSSVCGHAERCKLTPSPAGNTRGMFSVRPPPVMCAMPDTRSRFLPSMSRRPLTYFA